MAPALRGCGEEDGVTPVEPSKDVHIPPGDRAAAVSVGRGLGGRKRPHRVKGGQLARPAEEEVQDTRRGREPGRWEQEGPAWLPARFHTLTTNTVA